MGRIPGDGEGGRTEDRITVEVLNGTTIDGLARRLTWHLRRQGIDVVFYGSAETTEAESTLVIARRGDTAAARDVRDAIAVGVVVDEPMAQLLLDVTVVLGRDADSIATSVRN